MHVPVDRDVRAARVGTATPRRSRFVPHGATPAGVTFCQSRTAVVVSCNEPVVGADPDAFRRNRRRRDVEHRVVELGAGNVGVDRTAGNLLLGRIVAREVGTDARPRAPAVARPKTTLPPKYATSAPRGRKRDRRLPIRAIRQPGERAAVGVAYVGRDVVVLARPQIEDAELPVEFVDADVPDLSRVAGCGQTHEPSPSLPTSRQSAFCDAQRTERIGRAAVRIVVLNRRRRRGTDSARRSRRDRSARARR